MRRKGFRFALVSLLIFSLAALAGCGSANTNTNATAEKTLKVGSDITYAPLEFMDEKNNPEGFDVDLMNAIGKDLGYKVQYVATGWDGLIPALNAGNYEAVISAMTITPERAKSVLFSNRYFLATQLVAVKKDSNIKSIADLKNKRVGVQMGTTGETALEKIGINPKKYKTNPDALNDLLNGGLDAVVADSPTILWFKKQNPDKNIETVKGDFENEYYGIAFKLDNKALADKVNASIQKLIDNGTYSQIYKKWFDTDAPKL